MKLKANRNVKRGALAVFASGAAAAASLAVLPASPALAYTEQCSSYTLSTVAFKVCTLELNGASARARVVVTSGPSYISGYLAFSTPTGSFKSCSGKYYVNNSCEFSETSGSGTYQSAWNSAGGSLYAGPSVHVS